MRRARGSPWRSSASPPSRRGCGVSTDTGQSPRRSPSIGPATVSPAVIADARRARRARSGSTTSSCRDTQAPDRPAESAAPREPRAPSTRWCCRRTRPTASSSSTSSPTRPARRLRRPRSRLPRRRARAASRRRRAPSRSSVSSGRRSIVYTGCRGAPTDPTAPGIQPRLETLGVGLPGPATEARLPAAAALRDVGTGCRAGDPRPDRGALDLERVRPREVVLGPEPPRRRSAGSDRAPRWRP